MLCKTFKGSLREHTPVSLKCQATGCDQSGTLFINPQYNEGFGSFNMDFTSEIIQIITIIHQILIQ
jgi:hypothetical protein